MERRIEGAATASPVCFFFGRRHRPRTTPPPPWMHHMKSSCVVARLGSLTATSVSQGILLPLRGHSCWCPTEPTCGVCGGFFFHSDASHHAPLVVPSFFHSDIAAGLVP